MDDRTWYYVVGFIGAMIALFERRRLVKRRSEAGAAVAGEAGADFHETGSWVKSRNFWHFPVFRDLDDAEIRNVFKRGESLSFQLYTRIDEADDGMTVAAIQLPKRILGFELTPRAALTLRQRVFGDDSLEFDEDQEFTRRFRLTAVDRDRVYSGFSLELRSALGKRQDLLVQGGSAWVVFCTIGKRVEPQEVPKFLEEAESLARKILDHLAA